MTLSSPPNPPSLTPSLPPSRPPTLPPVLHLPSPQEVDEEGGSDDDDSAGTGSPVRVRAASGSPVQLPDDANRLNVPTAPRRKSFTDGEPMSPAKAEKWRLQHRVPLMYLFGSLIPALRSYVTAYCPVDTGDAVTLGMVADVLDGLHAFVCKPDGTFKK